MESPVGRPKNIGPLVGALVQGTACTRFLVFVAATGELVTYHAMPVGAAASEPPPEPGWAEVDADDLVATSVGCIDATVDNLRRLDIDPADIVAVGIANQRETVVAWSKSTGRPLYKAILWNDTRTADMVCRLRSKRGRERAESASGVPVSTYFSATKMRWLVDNVPAVGQALAAGDLAIGTVDTWLLYNLAGGVYATDATNAGRTALMDLATLRWDAGLAEFYGVGRLLPALPAIRSSSEVFGHLSKTAIKGAPVSGCLGDQQAALVGQGCLRPGQTNCTYGTGCFVLRNVGARAASSGHGLVSTVAYKMGPAAPPVYALEGSVAVAGGAVAFLQNNLGMFERPADVEALAGASADCGDVYFVPAFHGLFAPHWRPDARGLIIGLTQFTSKQQLCRAALEAVSFQARDVLDAMRADSKLDMSSLLVDGAMSRNDLLMQMQADALGIPVLRPTMLDATALGAAIAAGQAEGVDIWDGGRSSSSSLDEFQPRLSDDERDARFERWTAAVERSKGWSLPPQAAGPSARRRVAESAPAAIFFLASFLMVKLADHVAAGKWTA